MNKVSFLITVLFLSVIFFIVPKTHSTSRKSATPTPTPAYQNKLPEKFTDELFPTPTPMPYYPKEQLDEWAKEQRERTSVEIEVFSDTKSLITGESKRVQLFMEVERAGNDESILPKFSFKARFTDTYYGTKTTEKPSLVLVTDSKDFLFENLKVVKSEYPTVSEQSSFITGTFNYSLTNDDLTALIKSNSLEIKIENEVYLGLYHNLGKMQRFLADEMKILPNQNSLIPYFTRIREGNPSDSTETVKWFSKISPAQKEPAKGNRIIWIRRLKTEKQVEIKILSHVLLGTNLTGHNFHIGDQSFPIYQVHLNLRLALIRISEQDFDKLKDNSPMSYSINSPGKEQGKQQKPENEIVGTSFGRLNKKTVKER